MKRCVFQSLLMLSLQERTGRRVPFDPVCNLVRGTNNTGKSSLLKQLYHTFGAIPAVVHPKWKDAEVRSVVHFTVDGKPYIMLKNGDHYSVFDGGRKRLIRAKSVTKELSPFFADLFNFRLQLQSKKEQSQATPAFLFLPYYIDQDAGWSKNWASFNGLGQFSNWRRDVVEYHLGVRPNAYYEAKSGLLRIREELKKLEERRAILNRVLTDLRAELSRVSFTIDVEAYRQEIERLLVACNKLQKRQSDLKRDLTRLYNNRTVFEAQLSITTSTAKELKQDYQYAVNELHDEVECPTCGTLHTNSFAERFAVAVDESRCRELEAELRTDLADNETAITKVNEAYSGTTAGLEEAKQLLGAKQGEVTLQQLIENEGRKEARVIVDKEVAAVTEEIGRANSAIFTLQQRMEMYEDQDRRFRIRTQYVNRMRRFVQDLGVVNLPEKQYGRMDCMIQETGSGLPRGLLAYYYAILQTIVENESATYCPIVLDSPRQQDQDDENWLRILKLLRDEQPKGSQLILSLRGNKGVDFPGKVLEYEDKYQLLNKAGYQDVFQEVMSLVELSSADDRENSLY
jgi:predicted  nucleic acid-binding Zn-ribbon protein